MTIPQVAVSHLPALLHFFRKLLFLEKKKKPSNWWRENQAVFKLAFVIFPGHTQPTFWSFMTSAPPDWESESWLARPWLPGPHGRLHNPDPCLLPLQVLGTSSTKKDRAPAQGLLPAFSQPCHSGLGKCFIHAAGFCSASAAIHPFPDSGLDLQAPSPALLSRSRHSALAAVNLKSKRKKQAGAGRCQSRVTLLDSPGPESVTNIWESRAFFRRLWET